MKLVMAGIGNFGISWYTQLKTHYPRLRVAVADPDARKANLLAAGDPFYPSLEEALDREQPDFLLNLTPPAVHTRTNHLAFDRRLPVLCEKPIAEDYREAVEVVERAAREGIPFMIAENYRRRATMRKARLLIEQGAIGSLTGIDCQFRRDFWENKAYLLAMPNPLLVDVAIHHLDAVRYLSGSEGQRIFAYNYNPPGSPFPGNAAVVLLIELSSGARVTYNGSLAAKGAETDWMGRWRIEGSAGVLHIERQLYLEQGGKLTLVRDRRGIDRSTCLDEFLSALREGRRPESSGEDYLKTQSLVHFAEISHASGRMEAIEHVL